MFAADLHALGMYSRQISDFQISSSRYYCEEAQCYPPWQARLNVNQEITDEKRYWRAGVSDWIQVPYSKNETLSSFCFLKYFKEPV